MDFTATDIIGFMLLCSWTLLSLTPTNQKNPAYALLLATQETIRQALNESLVVFAPGLLDILQSQNPPTIIWLKTLPTRGRKRWGVYIIILEKEGCRPKIYIGSSVEATYGISNRFSQYNRGVTLPLYVDRALNEGFVISHKGLLCWMPIPTPSKATLFNALILLLETCFTILFWAMVSRNKDYKLPHLCPWVRDTLEYDGCCNHSALKEGIKGITDGVTPEEADAIHAERSLRNSRRDQATRGKERIAEDSKRHRDSNLASRKWECDICNVNFGARNQLNHHLTLKIHLDKAAGVVRVVKNPVRDALLSSNLASQRYYCSTCKYNAPTNQKLNSHLATLKHINKVQAANIGASDLLF